MPSSDGPANAARVVDCVDNANDILAHLNERIDSVVFRLESLFDRMGTQGPEKPDPARLGPAPVPAPPVRPTTLGLIHQLVRKVERVFEQLDRAQQP